MSIFSNIWGSLIINTVRGGANALEGTSVTRPYHGPADPVQYRKHRTYKSKLIQEASRIAIATAMNEINQLYPKYLKDLQKKKRAVTEASQRENLSKLIENQKVLANAGYGTVDAGNGHSLFATDKYGNLVPTALMLHYTGEEDIDSGQYYSEPLSIDAKKGTRTRKHADDVDSGDAKAKKLSATFKTKVVCHIDLVPQVSISSSKNLILTPVQGRDFTRKELVSGGDIQFSISGEIASDQSGVYPTMAVQKFLKVMQYGGVLTIKHFMFNQMGITRVIIKDFNLGTPEYMNIQPYSFSCVAVEPDEEIQVKDTIQAIDTDLQYATPLSKWQRLLLDDQFSKITQNAINGLLNSSISTLTDLSSGQI